MGRRFAHPLAAASRTQNQQVDVEDLGQHPLWGLVLVLAEIAERSGRALDNERLRNEPETQELGEGRTTGADFRMIESPSRQREVDVRSAFLWELRS